MAGRMAGAAGGILSYFTRHGTAANLLLVILIALGLAAVPRMRAQFFPDVIVDDVTVNVTWDGAGADDVDAGITQVLEPVLLAVEGVEDATSRSTEGRANIDLSFEPGWDMARAASDVQAAVDAVTELPEEADEPTVRRGAWRDRVTDVVITGPVGVDQLGRFADEFVTRLFAAGVTRTTIRGLAAPNTIVEVPSAALVRHDVTMAQIADAIEAAAETSPAGDVSGGSARVRTGVAKRSVDEIEAVVLRANDDGSNLTVGDVARVIVEGIDRERAYYVGAHPAVSVRVDRSDRGDAIDIQNVVQDVADEMVASLPAEVRIDLIRTRAEAITGRLNILLDNGLMGLLLVVALLFLFLNARTAFWVAAGIPVSMLATIALMYASGLTINMISLFALIITTGIVVDDAIVVGEHADFRSRRLGEGPVEAAENAARRMAPPVISATITTVIAFFGLTAISGRFGDLISDIPFTVIAVLMASLVECFLILPNHMSHALAHSAKEHWYDLPSRVVNRGFGWVQAALFRPLMAGVIRARYPVMALVLVVLATQVALLIRGDVQWRFFNSPEQGSISGNFAMAPGARREDTMAMMREMQRATAAVAARYEAEHGRNPLVYVLAEVGGNTGRGLSGVGTKDEELLGSIAIELIDADLRPYSSFRFLADLQEEVRSHPLVEVLSFRGWRSGPGGDALDVEFYGADSETLKAAAEALKARVSQFPEVSALEDSLAYDKEELILELTAQGTAVGFTIDGLGRVLRNRLNGIEAATYPDGPRSAAIRVELPTGELTADFLDRTLLRSASGQYLPLADIVTVERRTGFSTIRRENGLRVVSVTGDISEDDPARAEAVMEALERTILPAIESEYGVAWQLSGLAEQENEFLADAMTGLMLCLLGIYLTLAWIFSSWTRPVVVMAIIPFGLVGTIYGHALWEIPLSMFTVVGLIGMTGIIINDSIVLVGTVDEYSQTRGLVPAIIDATADRLRPVFLTTATTVLGLAPLLYESSQQAQFLKPTVVTLVYGLGFGMVLVLLMVPALLAMQQDVSRHIAAARRALGQPSRARAMGAVIAVAALGLGGLFGLTLGHAVVTGALPGIVTGAFPGLAGVPAMPAALGLFLAGAAVLLLIVYTVTALVYARRSAGA
ncbi:MULTISPECIES: efflux RND transporter permease subunit [Actibacterium]|uniref:Multidrug efflux pump subunit AcrB n=1 Tax=Actibacterium naphthalenivorans TaxID=1614693 RepID=A0A840CIV6_9RHOB|nr:MULTISPECIES: efflux RND transporter permease subunit [Actibacterium]ALG91315.1 acriflavine resistance protein B [Actibacterium sp. EMB200-NS6]MBB4022706.1 multidrug efflux pump subunit AcrB [Actibacterium naphthalenivorans]